jgi:hypothetical protein
VIRFCHFPTSVIPVPHARDHTPAGIQCFRFWKQLMQIVKVIVKVIDKLHNISFSFVEACLERSRALCLQSLNANFIFLAGIT